MAIIFLCLAIIFSFYFDSQIMEIIYKFRTSFLNDFFLFLEKSTSLIVVFVFLTLLFLFRNNERKWVLPLWVTFGISFILSFLLKVSFQRFRPFQNAKFSIFPTLEMANHLTWNFSFPSLHAMIAFCVIPFLNQEYPKFKYFWIFFAIVISISRIYFGLHFLSDVIVGGILGYIIGTIVVELEKDNKFWENFYLKKFRK